MKALRFKYPEVHRVLMFGDRTWHDSMAIINELEKLQAKHGKGLIIISGGATGADSECAFQARRLSIHVAEVAALWDTRGRGAGPQRNTAMLALQPHEAIGFHRDISKSKGSKNMKKQLEEANVPVRIVRR